MTVHLDHRWIIKLLGGATALSRELGHNSPDTVNAWRKRRVIPIRQIPGVLDVAARLGIALEPADFFGPERVAA